MNGVKTTIAEQGSNICMYKMCTITEKEFSVVVSFPKYVMWKENRKLIQDVFPELSPDEREFMISGWTPAEWEEQMTDPADKCTTCGRTNTYCLCDMD